MQPKKLGFNSDNSEDTSYETMKGRVLEDIKHMFRPEFLNRIDDIIVFHPLNEENIKDIVKLLNYTNALKRAFSLFIIPIAIRKHAKLKASMLQDIEKGKLTEVDAINGAVSAFGRTVGCPTPMNDRVVEIIHRIEQGELRPSFDNLRLFE